MNTDIINLKDESGNDVVGKIIKTTPPIIPPVAKKMSPIFLITPLPKELINPE